MTPERIERLIGSVAVKYAESPVCERTKLAIIEDISSLMKQLHCDEGFLSSFKIDPFHHVMLCQNPDEDMAYISYLPYIFDYLRGKKKEEEQYLVYVLLNPTTATLLGSVSFEDMCVTTETDIGFDSSLHDAHFLGTFYPKTNKFKKGKIK